ncbi:Uncharacterised protein [Mycobacteroides abscessus subsp. massiliense]|nr:Uncharacterised protein [Mycobacteroides abscessus subsp. massiliense]
MNVHRESETVEQLGTQLPLLGIHGADQHESRIVRMRYAVALHMYPAHRRRVQDHID